MLEGSHFTAEQLKHCREVWGSPAHGEKISRAKTGRPRHPASWKTRKKMSLTHTGRKPSVETCFKISRSHLGLGHTKESKEKNRLAHLGWKPSRKTKKQMSASHLKVMNTPEVLLKERLATIKRIQKNYGICFPNYNLDACEYFKQMDLDLNTKGEYAMYGGGEHLIKELGYFVDYFNDKIHLIMEYDEPSHYVSGKLTKKDKTRQKEIEKFFGPSWTFIRIKETANAA